MAGRKALKVEILGDASGAVKAAKQTEHALHGVEDQAQKTTRETEDLSDKMDKLSRTAAKTGAVLGGTLVTSLKATAVGLTAVTAASVGWAAAGTAAFVGIAGAATGLVAVLGGVGFAFAAMNEVVKNEALVVGVNMLNGMKDATKSFIPILLDLIHRANDIFNDFKPALTFLFNSLAPLFERLSNNTLSGLLELVPLFVDLVRTGMPFVSLLADNIVPLFHEIAKFTPSSFLAELIRDLMPVIQELIPVAKSLGSLVSGLVGPVADMIRAALPTISAFVTTLASGLGPILATLAQNLGGLLVSALQTLTPVIAAIAPQLDKLLGILGPELGKLLSTLLPPLGSLIASVAPLLPMLLELAGALINAFVTAIAPSIEAVTPFIEILVAQLEPILAQLIPIIQETAAELGPEFARQMKESMPLFMELFRILAPYIPTLVEITAQAILFFAQFQTNAKTIWDLIVGFRYLKDVLSGVFDGVVDAFKATINGITSIWNNLRFTVPPIPGTNLGGFTLDFPDIPRFDKGGVVPGKRGSPQMILAHGGETVLPTHMSNSANERWVTYEDGSTGLERYGKNGYDVDHWYGVTRAMDPEAYNRKAAMEYAAMVQHGNLKAGMEIGKWPVEDVKKLAALIAGGKTGAGSMNAAGTGPAIFISVEPITGQAIVSQVATYQRNGGRTPWQQVKL